MKINKLTKKNYDTKEGIEKILESSLEDLNKLISARFHAGYDNNERMNEFYILGGLFKLDTRGNCMRASVNEPILKDELDFVPNVLTDDEYWEYVEQTNNKYRGFSLGSNIPEAHIICSVCNCDWELHNLDDITKTSKTKVIDLKNFVGQTLDVVKKHYRSLTNAIYFMQSEILIKNNKYIDLSLKYPDAEKGSWKKSIVKNEDGWLSKDDGITDDYIIEEGDSGFFNVWTYTHKMCNIIKQENSEREYFKTVFEEAGFSQILLKTTINEYWNNNKYGPWFLVTTEIGIFKIGWRKRVINIEWPKNKINPDYLSLFDYVKDTKDSSHIHAWKREQAVEYLKKIKEAGLVSQKT